MATVQALAAGVGFADLKFLGNPGVIATALLHGPDGVAIVDPGPTTTMAALEEALAARGFGWRDIRAILITHIHLDHAGATGCLLREAPDALVYVHERGAPHLIDPSKLLVSAGRLYGDDMSRLWSDVLPVPEGNVRAIGDAASIAVAGHTLEAAWTPGHAWHHVSYFLPGPSIAFVGDTAGICRPGSRVVIPPTPPPDIDLEAWRASTDTILAWNPGTLFLTHFGPHAGPRLHFQTLWQQMDDWSRRVRASLSSADEDDAARANEFMRETTRRLAVQTSPEEADAYARAGRFDYSWTGLARYWKRAGA